MSKFKITWGTSKVQEVEVSECSTPDQFAMQRWGFNSAAEVFGEYGTVIEVVDEATPPTFIKTMSVSETKGAAEFKAAQVKEAKARVAAAA